MRKGARDLLKEIEKELKKRKWGAAVRLEVDARAQCPKMIDFLLHVLEIHHKDLYVIDGPPLDLTFLSDFCNHVKKDFDQLIYQTLIPPSLPPRIFMKTKVSMMLYVDEMYSYTIHTNHLNLL